MYDALPYHTIGTINLKTDRSIVPGNVQSLFWNFRKVEDAGVISGVGFTDHGHRQTTPADRDK